MEYRSLGRSGLKVSVMALGTNAFGLRTAEPTAAAIVHRALDAGINLLDTADVYAGGESERILGKALSGHRSQALIATKGFYAVGSGPNDRGASRGHILDALDASLRRLGTEYIDLYQLHDWDDSTPLEETLRALDDAVRWGKVRYIGCSKYAAWQIMKALALQDRHGLARFVCNQPEYSPIFRRIEQEVLPVCLSEGVGQIVFWPLAGGLLTGKYQPGEQPPPGSRAQTQPDYMRTHFWSDRNFAIAGQMSALAVELGLSVSHLTLSWAMSKPGVSSVIVGVSRVEQLEQNLGACEVRLSPEAIQRVDSLSASSVWVPARRS